MTISELFNSGKIMHKKAKLKRSIKLDNGEQRKCGDIVSVLIQYNDRTFQIEDNDFACIVKPEEIEFVNFRTTTTGVKEWIKKKSAKIAAQ